MMLINKQGFILILINIFLLTTNSCCLNSFAEDSNVENSNLIKLEARIDEPVNLNLEKALTLAVLQNLDIDKARTSSNLYKWRLWENYGNFLPDIKAGISSQRFDGTLLLGGVFAVMALSTNNNLFVRYDYHFLDGGRGFFNTLAAKKLYKSSKENLSVSMKDTFLLVTKAYNQLLKEKAQLDVLSKSVEEANAALDLNNKLLNQGVGTKFDVLQSQALQAEQEQLFISQQASFREASINLARVLNLEQGTHINPSPKDLEVRKLYDIDRPIADLLRVAKDNRSEIKKAQLDYYAQKNYIGVAYSGFLPQANFYGQYGGNGRVFFHRTKISEVVPDAISLDANGNPIVQMVSNRTLYQAADVSNVSPVIKGAGKPFLTATDDSLMASKFIGIQVDWNLGKGLGVSTVSKINQAKADANTAKINIDILSQKVEQEVRAAFLRAQTTEKLIEVSEKRLNSATEALRLAKIRLENGVGINTELLNAQKQYSGALASNVNAVVDYNNAQADLLHSLGVISIESLLKKN